MTIKQYVGARVKRKEDRRLITGRATYVDDLHPVGLRFAAFVRSPYAHARITHIDVTAAREAGAQIFTWNELKQFVDWPAEGRFAGNKQDSPLPNRPLLADGVVRMMGEAVAVVVADSATAARDAADLVDVHYEGLPVVVDSEEALAEGAAQVYDNRPNLARVRLDGDKAGTEAALSQSEVVIDTRIVNQRMAAVSLETRGILAEYNPGSQNLAIWLSNQAPHLARDAFARALPQVTYNKIRVVAPEVGGGFGAKIMVYPEEVTVAALAVHLGGAIKWVESRSENLLSTYHGRCQVDYVKLGASKDGIINALDLRIVADIGAYANEDGMFIPTLTLMMATGCYKIPHYAGRIEYVYTNTLPTTAYRGAGRPEAAYMIERAIEELAAELHIDPMEIRRRNFLATTDFPYKTPTGETYDSGDYQKAFDLALQLSGYEKLKQEREAARAEGRLFGIGIGSYVERGAMGWENAVVRVDPAGKVSVFTGTSPHGQGSETTMAQIVADLFGLNIEDIEVSHGDTKDTPYGQGTYGSRSAAVGGSAVRVSAMTVRDKARKLAAHMLEANEEDIVFEDGKVHVAGVPQQAISFAKLAATAYQPHRLPKGMEIGLESSRFFDPGTVVYPFGTHICAVEVDRDTGDVRIRTYVSVDDCGNVLNPMIVDGQVHGGVAQGIAQALYEEVVYDESGQMISGTLMDYTLATSTELPSYTTGRTFTPTPTNPLGAKGIGESGATGAPPAIVNAVMDALRPLGITNLAMPLRPEKLWKAINGVE